MLTCPDNVVQEMYSVMLQVECPEGCSGTIVRPAEGRLPAGVQQFGCQPRLLATQRGGFVCYEVKQKTFI